MSNHKKFGLIGIGSDVQFGKGGGRLTWVTDHFNSRDSTDSSYVNLRVATSPSDPNDAASKAYVDGLVQGASPKESVRAATTIAGTLASSFENGDTIDGVVLATGDRILIKNQAAAETNGIYTVNASGAPTRALDANTAGKLAAAFTFVEEGTANGEKGFVTTFDSSDVLGTDPVTWVQFSSAGNFTASNGITLSGSDFQLDFNGLSANTIVSGDTLAFYDASLTNESKTTVANFITDLGIVTTADIPASEQSELAALDALGNGMVAKTANATYSNRTISVNGAGNLDGLAITNGDGVSGNPTIGLDINGSVARSDAVDGSDRILVYNVTSGANEYYLVSEIATAGSTNAFGTITPSGNSNATSVVADAAPDTVTFAASDGIQIDGTAGTDTLTFTFTRAGMADTATVGTDTVPFFDASASNQPEFRSFANIIADQGILTTTDIPASEQSELAALDALGNGMVAKTANATYAARTITAGTTGLEGISITNGDGVSGNPTIGLNITGLTSDNTIEDTDEFPYYNGTNNRKTTWAAIKSELRAEVPAVRTMYVTVNFNSSSPVAVGTLPNNSRVLRASVDVNTTWNVSETLDIGINGGAADAIMADTENDLQFAAIYRTDVDYRNSSGSAQTVEVAITSANTPSQGSARVVVEYYTSATI
jgi:hypothetical protein